MAIVSGSRALVTGAGSGIGRATALRLAQQGCRIALLDIDAESVHGLAREIIESGGVAVSIGASVADPESVASAFAAMDAAFGGIDILINNAGITGNKSSLDLDCETWSRVIAINQSGTFYCAQQAGQRMRAGAGGIIVNLASIYGLVAAPSRLAYGATKAAVVMMTKILAVEWAQHNIRVNCVAPGYVETPGTSALAQAGVIDLEALKRRTPQGRLAQPADVASAIVRFCDEEAAHVTGQVLAVDGGWSAYGYI
jgi:NAD(P)-dependent dehydrogenase (short-subunit alcohol dehydrogenase family)